jgi:hypothetical protein
MTQLELLDLSLKSKKTTRKLRPLPSQWELLNKFHINIETGRLYFTDLAPFTSYNQGPKARNFNFAPIITKGTDGRFTVNQLLQHRIIFKMMTGEEPPIIDHINGDPTDNRPINLRAASKAQNTYNSIRPKTNTTGHKNVYFSKRKKKYYVQFCINNQKQYLGTYADINQAAEADKQIRAKLHGEFARHQ